MNRSIITRFCFLLSLSFAQTYGLAEELVTLTNESGQSIEAEIVSVSQTGVEIERADGNRFTLDLETLNDSSKEVILEWQKKEREMASAKTELVVTTLTGSRNNGGTRRSSVFIRVNGDDTLYELKPPGNKGFKVGATDTFRGIFLDITKEEIEFIELEIQGDDAWFAERIEFQVIEGGEKSPIVDFRISKWMSGVDENVNSIDSDKFMTKGKFSE